jgi:AcrR family transcriptional regulator
MHLFLENGYKGTSMDAVARAAGISKPVVYDCFESKADLFAALLNREEQRMFEHFGSALGAGRLVGDVEATLRAGFTAMLRAATSTPKAYQAVLLNDGDAQAAIAARVREGRDRQITAIVAVARTWLDGQVPDERLGPTAEFVGQTVFALGETGVKMIVSQTEGWTPESLGQALAELASRGYRSLVAS